MKSDTQHFFWQSYLDVFTSLFIVMLVLFVLSFKLLSDLNAETKGKLDKIREVYNSIEMLDTVLFIYEPEYKRYVIREQIQFGAKQSIIPSNKREYLTKVGNNLSEMFQKLKLRYQDTLKYSLILEGMASNDSYNLNYELSYARAKAVFDFWESTKIKFDPEIVEVLISGSGTSGVGRDSTEKNNQRILVQIIPKLSKLLDNISDKQNTSSQRTQKEFEKTINDKPKILENTVNKPKPDNRVVQKSVLLLVTIDSYPSQATILIDGVNYGKTPRSISLKEGYYNLTLIHEDKDPLYKTLEVKEGGNLSYSFILPKKTNVP